MGVSFQSRYHLPGGCGTAPISCIYCSRPTELGFHEMRNSSVPVLRSPVSPGWGRLEAGEAFGYRSLKRDPHAQVYSVCQNNVPIAGARGSLGRGELDYVL